MLCAASKDLNLKTLKPYFWRRNNRALFGSDEKGATANYLNIEPFQSLTIRGRRPSTWENLKKYKCKCTLYCIAVKDYCKSLLVSPRPRWGLLPACRGRRWSEDDPPLSQWYGNPPIGAGWGTERKRVRRLKVENLKYFSILCWSPLPHKCAWGLQDKAGWCEGGVACTKELPPFLRRKDEIGKILRPNHHHRHPEILCFSKLWLSFDFHLSQSKCDQISSFVWLHPPMLQ